MAERHVTGKELDAAGGNLEVAMARIAAEANEADEAAVRRHQTPSLQGLGVPGSLGGFTARPISGGVLAVLESMGHPIMSEQDGSEMSLTDILSLLFVLTHPTITDIVQWAQAGVLSEKAIEWGFDLDTDRLDAMQSDVQQWLDDAFSAPIPAPDAEESEKAGNADTTG